MPARAPHPATGRGTQRPLIPVPETAASGPLRRAALSQHRGAGLGGGGSPWALPSRPPSSPASGRSSPAPCVRKGARARRRDATRAAATLCAVPALTGVPPLSSSHLRPRGGGALPPEPGQELQGARAGPQLRVHHRLRGRPLRQGPGRHVAPDQGGQGRRVQQPRVSLAPGPARQPLGPHGQPRPFPVRGLLKGAPPSDTTSICMVCLSFEQSVLKKMEKLGEKIRWEREGWLIRKNHVVGFLLCFVLTWSSSSGPSDMLAAPRGAPLSASVTKDAWTGQRPARPGRRGSRFLSHRPGHWRPRRSVLFRSLLESRACAAPFPACVCACLCVRLLEENRTVVSDLHYGRRTRVACLTALCETLVL